MTVDRARLPFVGSMPSSGHFGTRFGKTTAEGGWYGRGGEQKTPSPLTSGDLVEVSFVDGGLGR